MRDAPPGRAAERRVRAHLEKRGFRVLAENFRSRSGEIDLVVGRPGEIRFVEVRSRAKRDFLNPALSVDGAKRARIRLTAEIFLQKHPAGEAQVFFDVASVVGDEIDYIEQAFE